MDALNRTYEVLKVVRQHIRCPRVSTLNRTYEVLKERALTAAIPSAKPLNRTYEVLKVVERHRVASFVSGSESHL